MLTKISKMIKKVFLYTALFIVSGCLLFFIFTLAVFKIKELGAAPTLTSIIEIPYRYNRAGHIIVDVEINGMKYPFILDSGGSNKIFTSAEIPDNGLRFVGFGIDANGTPFFPLLKKLSKVSIADVEYLDFTFGKMDSPFSTCIDDGMGIIGKELMRHHVWQFFPEQQIIRISNEIEQTIQSEKAKLINCDIGRFGHQIYTLVKLGNDSLSRYQKCIIDTGFNGTITIPNDSSLLSLRKIESFGDNSKGLASSDSSNAWIARAERIQFSDEIIDGSLDIFINTKNFKAVGVEFLRAYNFTLDWKNAQIILDPISDVGVKLAGFGINLNFDNSRGIYVDNILENSKAYNLMLRPGTKILEVNGVSHDDISDFCQLRDLIKSNREVVSLKYIVNNEIITTDFFRYQYLEN